MLDLTENDRVEIQNCYRNFLQSLKNDLQSNCIKSSLSCYAIIVKLLKDGRFSFNGAMKFSSLFDYLNLPNIAKGAQVMYGVGCCRHVNLLVNDIMKTLGFNSDLLYVRIDESNIYHKVTPLVANHVVAILHDNNDEYLLDAYNNFVCKIVGYDLEPTYQESVDDKLITKYPDDNVKRIGLILKKYYKLQELGIDYVYDY